MKKLNKDQRAKIESTKEAIVKFQEAQTFLYNHIVTELNSEGCEDSDWLHDYVFNCTTDDEYTSMVRDKLFE